MKEHFKNKYIITGAPSTGKTTLLSALENKGYNTKEEIARKVIKQELALGSNKLPWLNVEAFSALVLLEMQTQLTTVNEKDLCFFDRGIPDIIAYLRVGNKVVPAIYEEQTTVFNYNKTVFLAPVWDAIFSNDEERKENIEQAYLIEKSLIKTYKSLGFAIHTLPKASIEERVAFIEKILE